MTDPVKISTGPLSVAINEFFESTPPGKTVLIKDVGRSTPYGILLQSSAISLHCETDTCRGIRFFEPVERMTLIPGERTKHFLRFVCRNCQKTSKTYAFWSLLSKDNNGNGELMKFGEHPPFGPPTPPRVISLIGGERDYYLKGRRAENQDLGIAAFAYYRRVVENQKTRIIDEITRVAQKVGASADVLKDLATARSETQFSKAVDAIKHGIPQSLLIDGHNPLVLLHSALSEGLHAQTDEQCLELATSIRVVLTELAERISLALKEEIELSTAVTRLLRASVQKAKRDTNVG